MLAREYVCEDLAYHAVHVDSEEDQHKYANELPHLPLPPDVPRPGGAEFPYSESMRAVVHYAQAALHTVIG